jgi:hypothetical protein
MVYHYGDWENTPENGWVWIPSNDPWSPACVQWIYYDDQVGWAPRRAQNRNWLEPWEQNNVHPWVVVRMENFNRENVVSYRMNNVPMVRDVQTARIERRAPDLKIVQTRVKEPIQVVKIEREPVQRNPVRNVVTPPVERNPGKTDVTPPVERTPVRTDVTPPVDRNQGRTDVKPPVERTPVKNDAPPTVQNRTAPQNTRQIYRMQIPPQERHKVDRYQPTVEKNVLRKKAPVNNVNKPNRPETTPKQKDGTEKK